MAWAVHSTSLVRRFLVPFAIALLASWASISCSAGPPGPSPPVLVYGPADPGPSAGGATGGGAGGDSNSPDAGPDDGSSAAPVAPCTALGECCSRFDMQDPAQAWCEESLVQASGADECAMLLTYWGC